MQWDRCAAQVYGGWVFVKPYNINEYNISRLINNPDSLAPREAYYPLARTNFVFLPFVIHLDVDRWVIQKSFLRVSQSVYICGSTFFFLKSFSSFFFGTVISEQMVVGSVVACSQDWGDASGINTYLYHFLHTNVWDGGGYCVRYILLLYSDTIYSYSTVYRWWPN